MRGQDPDQVTVFSLDTQQYQLLLDRSSDLCMGVRDYIGLCLTVCDQLPPAMLLAIAEGTVVADGE